MSRITLFKIELCVLLLVTNLLAFAAGMFLPMIQFDLLHFASGLEVIHWMPILFGVGLFLTGFVQVMRKASRMLDAVPLSSVD